MDEAILELQYAIDDIEESRRYSHDDKILAAIANGVVLALKRQLMDLQQGARTS